MDHHTILGKTDLPQTLTFLLSLALESAPIPTEENTAVVNELLRVGANLCMDHSTLPIVDTLLLLTLLIDENRAVLLEARFPQAVLDLLEAYAETIPSPPTGEPLPLDFANLGIVRTCVGVLLNASLNFGICLSPLLFSWFLTRDADAVKFHLISLQAAVTIIKLSSVIYPPTAWTAFQHNSGFAEEWSIRSQISSWIWRTVSTLKDVQDESKLSSTNHHDIHKPYLKIVQVCTSLLEKSYLGLRHPF